MVVLRSSTDGALASIEKPAPKKGDITIEEKTITGIETKEFDL